MDGVSEHFWHSTRMWRKIEVGVKGSQLNPNGEVGCTRPLEMLSRVELIKTDVVEGLEEPIIYRQCLIG